ncbi:MAG TPA: hypothetical protein VHE35_35800, partial [Kofleriaceae bacterium]|nr:hypothetical protein [Kofleriaceae bacterium]
MATYSGRRVAIAVLVIGFGVGALATWWMIGARPVEGAFVDATATPDGALAIRREAKSDRGFFELWRVRDGRLHRTWSGLIPHYAGHPGVIAAAATKTTATVRVIRGGLPRVFAFDLVHGAKIDSFELDPSLPSSPQGWTLPDVGTVGAEDHAIEALAQPDGGAALYAVDLRARRMLWRQPLPWQPTRVWVAGPTVGASDGAHTAGFELTTGAPLATPPAAPPPGL